MSSEKNIEKINIQAIVCHINPNKFIIEKRYQKKITNTLEYLSIDRKIGTIQIKRSKAKTIVEAENILEGGDHQFFHKRQFSGLIGIVNLQGFKFLVFVDEVESVSKIESIQIYQIHTLLFMPYSEEKLIKLSPQRQKIYRSIRQLSQILSSGFYFSHNHKLIHSLQCQNKEQYNKFTWNIRFIDQFRLFNVGQDWVSTVIQGFVANFQTIIEGNRIQYLLISRRSTEKGGTRYFDRGINQEGYVANFVQTEQILKINDYKISDVQIRGNVPIFFEQKGLTTKIKITRSHQLTTKIYEKHMQKLKKNYQRIFVINLLCCQKGGQKILIQQFQKLIKQANDQKINYLYYNFHLKVKGDHFQNVDQGINLVKDVKNSLNFFIIDKKQVISKQSGVFRTNCLDCLDRTNFFQAKLALYTVQQIFKLFKIKFSKDLNDIMNDPEAENVFVKNFKNLWADNGDAISWHYTGTGSTHTDITRDGKRGWLGQFKHKYKTITRFYNQNFYDFHKMHLVDLLLGKGIDINHQKIPQLMKERENQYVKKSVLQVYIFCWKAPKQIVQQIPPIIFPPLAKIIVIGIQEADNFEKWKKLLCGKIDTSKYIPVGEKISNKNNLVIYIDKSLQGRIKNVEFNKVKFKSSYFNIYLSTKCAVLIRFNIDNTKIVFASCQLQYGKDNFKTRLDNLRELHENAFQQQIVGQKKSDSILNDDIVFLLGNMNTTISSDFSDSFKHLETIVKNVSQSQTKIIRQMLKTDEFDPIQEALLQYRQYQEGQIIFPPSYRILTNGVYDRQKSGWPDRIWYSSQNKLACKEYNIISTFKTQHYPVFGHYNIQVQSVNEEAKKMTYSQVTQLILGSFLGSEFQIQKQQE